MFRRFHPLVVALPLLLPACDRLGHTTLDTRTTIDGTDTVHVVTEVVRDVARFNCLASRSGLCRIVVYTRKCEVDVSLREGRVGEKCTTQAHARLDVVAGTTRELRGMPGSIRQCASAESTPEPFHCIN